MFIMGFFLLLCASTCTAVSLKVITYRTVQSNTLSSVSAMTSALSATFLALFFGVTMDDLIELICDPRLYPTFIVELLSFYVARKNFALNGEDVTSIKCAMLLSLLFVPIISVSFTSLLGFDQAINITYSSVWEMIAVLSVVCLFLLGYFYDKRVSRIKSWFYLLLTPLSLSFSMFFSSKMFQTHNGYSVMALICLFNGLIFGSMALSYLRTKPTLSRRSLYTAMGCGAAMVPFNVMAVSMLAVEFITLLKRLSQVFIGVTIDAVCHRRITLCGKDTLLIIALFTAAGWYYHR